MTRSEMIKEILYLQRELSIKRSADYYFKFSNSRLMCIIYSMRDEIDDKEENQDYRIYRAL